jgi:hypothetical protein
VHEKTHIVNPNRIAIRPPLVLDNGNPIRVDDVSFFMHVIDGI